MNLRKFLAIRRAKKSVEALPVISFGIGLYDTVEGSVIAAKCDKEIKSLCAAAFSRLDENTKEKFAFSPVNGEFVERVQFWKKLLYQFLTPEQARLATLAIIRHFIRIKTSAKG